MRQLLPTYREDVTDDDLREIYAYPTDRPWVRANMVSSLDGSAVVDGRSGGLGGEGDKRVFGVLRGLCDAVLVGAGTARTEGYRALRAKPEYAELRASLGQQPAPTLVIVSQRLDLDRASKLFVGGANRTIVVTAHNSDRQAREELSATGDVVIAGDFGVDIDKAIDALVERGLTRILCEGGPHLLSDLVSAGRLDELCLTLSPCLVGGPGPHILASHELPGPPILGLTGVIDQEGSLLVRYVRP